MRIYSLKEFTDLCIDIDMKGKNPLFLGASQKSYKKKYQIVKSKIVNKTNNKTLEDNNGIPYQEIVLSESKKVWNTNAITNLIVDYVRLEYQSNTFRRISSEGKWRKGIGYIPSTNKGLSDAEGFVNGKFLSLELKVNKDKQQESQKKRQKEVEADGGIYYLCRWVDFATFQIELNNLISIL